jgi:nitrate reductase beta subunit
MIGSSELRAQIARYQELARQAAQRARQAQDKMDGLSQYAVAHDRVTDIVERDLMDRRQALAWSRIDKTRVKTAAPYEAMMADMLAAGDTHIRNRHEQRVVIRRAYDAQEDLRGDALREQSRHEQMVEQLRRQLTAALAQEAAERIGL